MPTTRNPRPKTATAASQGTLGGVVMLSGTLGHLARDWVHECEAQDPPRKASFFVKSIGNYLG